MAEVSEKQRKEMAKLRKEGKLKNEAASFRLGPTHINRLREISQWRDISQTDLLRQFIDKEHKSIRDKRAEIQRSRGVV